MSEPQYGRYDSIARRWLALIERRYENFLDLCDTGRWRHYYTEAGFLDEMRKLLRLRERWAALAGVSLADDGWLADDAGPPETGLTALGGVGWDAEPGPRPPTGIAA
ncbi:MAG TPA: hypothetical protein VMC05_09670 [Xanthobacteraceae bacterium]|nr:hypothetical protein [Xanthobacteraceae bacterium]